MLTATMIGCGNIATVEETGEAEPVAAQTGTDGGTAAPDSGSSADALTGNGDKTIKVFLYMQEHEKEIYRGLVEQFVADHADEIKEVKFEITTQDEYNQKMIANMTAGDLPDVFYVGPAAVFALM